MEPTVEQFLEIFTEFDDQSEERVEYYMDQAKNQVSSTCFGDSYAHAVYLVTAHLLTLADPSRAQNGAIASEKAGDLAVSYKTQGSGNDQFEEYRQTQYGIQFITLVKGCVITVNVVS